MIIRTDNLVKTYGERNVVNGVSVEVEQGTIVGLLGPNGAGKTTTFYMIVGIEKPDDGVVTLDGQDISNLAMFERARAGIGYLPQEASIFSKMTVEENIKAVEILERNGLQCYSGLIVGEDWKKQDFDGLIDYLNGFEHPLVNIQPITPMPGTPLFDEYPYEITIPRSEYACWDMAHIVFQPKHMSKRRYYYHILRAYLKTSANKKQRKFIKEKYGKNVYRRVRKGATKIAFQYIKLMIFPK